MEGSDLSSPATIRRFVLPLLLLVFFAAGANSLVRNSATFDETAHLPAGLTYLERGDFRLNTEHPPLAKAWAALPLRLAGIHGSYGAVAWNGRPAAGAAARTGADQWVFGYELLNAPYRDDPRRDPRRRLVPGRIAILLLGVLLGLVVYRWSGEMWGSSGALLSLFLYALSPTMLAHAGLVTTDLPAALAYAVVLWCFWRFCRAPGPLPAAWVGLSVALALLTKFSALLLGPILVLLSVSWVAWPRTERVERGRRARAVVLAGGVALVVGYAGLWAGYGFRFDAARDPGYELDWSVVGLEEGLAADVIHTATEYRLAPEAYLYGLGYALGGAHRRSAYLNGEESIVGWRHYFPEAFLLKTPPATVLLLVWLLVGAIREKRWSSWNGWFLAIAAAVYFGNSVIGHLNIGHRHLAPVYPLLFVLLGGATRLRSVSRRPRVLAALLGGALASFVWATPAYLSYFNLVAGGPGGGARFLLDSNLDWGQDLARLKAWMDREAIPEIHLAYFGTGDPRAHGIEFRKLILVHDFDPGRPPVAPSAGDLVAVSVNLLHGLYYDEDRAVADEVLRRGWVSRSDIERWLDLRERLSRDGRRHPGLAEWLADEGLVGPERRRQLEAGLLSSWFERLRRDETPVWRAGDSLFVYRVPAPPR